MRTTEHNLAPPNSDPDDCHFARRPSLRRQRAEVARSTQGRNAHSQGRLAEIRTLSLDAAATSREPPNRKNPTSLIATGHLGWSAAISAVAGLLATALSRAQGDENTQEQESPLLPEGIRGLSC